jgi:hypothetical protein
MPVQVWSNVEVKVQSSASGLTTISSITKATTAVVTVAAIGTIANGDYVLIRAVGMSQVDNRLFRVAGVSGSTFELEGCDSTMFDDFISGSASEITFGTNLTVVSNISAAGGDFQYIDVTTIHDTIQKQIPGNASASTFTMDCQWQPDDPGLLSLKAASDNKAELGVMFVFSNGYRYMSTGYIGATLSPTGSAQAVVSTPVVITAFGRPTVYPT